MKTVKDLCSYGWPDGKNEVSYEETVVFVFMLLYLSLVFHDKYHSKTYMKNTAGKSARWTELGAV